MRQSLELINLNEWPTDLHTAKQIQEELHPQLIQADDFQKNNIQLIAGIDVGFEDNGEVTRAAIVVLSWPNLEIIEKVISRGQTQFPYIPGFLSFREIPEIIKALKLLKNFPELLFCDGQGIAHPRQMGIASHLGILTGLPTIGAAKSILVGKHAEVGEEKGDSEPLIYKKQTIGVALRTRAKVKPMYISLGHRISLPTAVDYVLKCTTKYRLPQATHLAHRLASLEKDSFK